jgi:deoxyribodipyrimidine photolyase
MSASAAASSASAAIHWFRKGLRLHDNPALLDACRSASSVFPVFVIDPWFADPAKVGAVRYNFLLQSLADIDSGLRARGSRLFVARGKPADVILELASRWRVNLVVRIILVELARDDTSAHTRTYADVRVRHGAVRQGA